MESLSQDSASHESRSEHGTYDVLRQNATATLEKHSDIAPPFVPRSVNYVTSSFLRS